MKTKDGREYKPGMTLYRVYAGSVTETKTQKLTKHLPDLAIGVDDRLHCINAYYADHKAAYVEAMNYWLHQMETCRTNLARLRQEQLDLL